MWGYARLRLGAICPEHGKVAGLVLPFCATQTMSLHLAEMSQPVAPRADSVGLMDQAGWHTTDKLEVPADITIIPWPTARRQSLSAQITFLCQIPSIKKLFLVDGKPCARMKRILDRTLNFRSDLYAEAYICQNIPGNCHGCRSKPCLALSMDFRAAERAHFMSANQRFASLLIWFAMMQRWSARHGPRSASAITFPVALSVEGLLPDCTWLLLRCFSCIGGPLPECGRVRSRHLISLTALRRRPSPRGPCIISLPHQSPERLSPFSN